jgi:hypothetical protein
MEDNPSTLKRKKIPKQTKKKLKTLKRKQLENFCRKNDIPGFTRFTKTELAEYIFKYTKDFNNGVDIKYSFEVEVKREVNPKLGSPRKFKISELLTKWEEYKKSRIAHKDKWIYPNGKPTKVEEEIKMPLFIKGFALSLGMSSSNFFNCYLNTEEKDFMQLHKYIKEECEMSKVDGFVLGNYPPQLAGLLLSQHGYSTKQDVKQVNLEVETSSPVAHELINTMFKGDTKDE